MQRSKAAGRYDLIERLGGGGQGEVWAVADRERGGQRLVMKTVAAVPGSAAVLALEFERLGRLDHPALPRVRDLGVLAIALGPLPAGAVYFTADEVAGAPLDRAMAAAPAGDRPLLLWSAAADVASALAVLHGAGLCHCDVTPANVLVSGRGADARAVLIDLGLSAVRGATGLARGTLPFMAPEAVLGVVDPRGDLWGLGATLFAAVRGHGPFSPAGDERATPVRGGDDRVAGGAAGDDRAALVRAILREPVPALHEREAPGLAGVIARLLAREPTARPASALAVVAELDQAAAALPAPVRRRPVPAVRPPPLAPALVGADAGLALLESALAACAGGESSPPVIVSGPIGADPRAVVSEAVRRHQRDWIAAGRSPATVRIGALDEVADESVGLADEVRARRIAVRRVEAARAAEGATILDVTGDPRAAAVVAATGAGHGPGLVVVVVEGEPPAVVGDARAARLGPVDAATIAAVAAGMIGRAVPAAWAERLHQAAGGLPAVAVGIVTALAVAGDPLAGDPAGDASGDTLDELRLRQIGERGPAARAAAEALAIWNDDGDLDLAIATAAALDSFDPAWPPRTARAPWLLAGVAALLELGVARDARAAGGELGPGRIRLVAGLAARIAGDPRSSSPEGWHRAAITAARAGGLAPERWIDHQIHVPVAERDVATLLAIAERRLRAGQPMRAHPLAEAAAAVGRWRDPRSLELVARALVAAGGYRRAIEHLEDLQQRLGDQLPPSTRSVLARAYQRAGDLDRAEAELTKLRAAAPADVDAGAAHARLLVARDRHAEALAIVAALDPLPRTAGGALAAEAAGSALLYRRDPDGADRRFREAEEIADALADRALAGRARALRGMVAQQRGDLATAGELYRAAADLARAGGDVHAAAVAELNRASSLAERGRHGQALPVLAAAAAELRALGRAELAVAELDRGVSLLAVGEVSAAAHAVAEAVAGARAAGLPHVLVHAQLLAGDVARRAGDRARARACYQEAIATGRELPDRGHPLRALAELDAGDDPAAAARALAEAAAADVTDDDRDRTVQTRARVALAGPLAAAEAGALVAAVAAVAERAAAADRLEHAWRAGSLAAALADAAGDRARGDALAARAEEAWSALAAGTAGPWRAGLAADPEAQALHRRSERSAPPVTAGVSSAGGATAEGEATRLRRLLALSRRLNGEQSLDRLLDDVIDAAIELTAGERGFLLLARGPRAELEVVVARGFAAGALADPGALSRSIAARAIATAEPVITVDAGIDERFGDAASVAALRLRSVLAVPLRQRGRVTGCLYVDHRLRSSAFDDEAAALVLELADIAAVAIENATLADDLRRGKAEIEALSERLAAEVVDREAELVVARGKLPPSRDRLGPGVAGIIGSSPELLAALDVVQRAAQVALPVVVVGESGTGKELVARALHDAGPRRDRPFVAVNCSAMPEALLESELFGHVRGAFTGAERDRKGLFEVADGGTLFLDEVAETGPAMQAKLLRVLQDGVVRRVGDERVRKVDVRVVAASQRPLTELALAGRFREDLRYRLDVITVVVPPLRARRTDLPVLVEHVLRRLVGDRPPPTITRAAWRALNEHAWPGNVRELENVLARAVALGGPVIDVADLPEAVTTRPRPGPGVAPPEDLQLRPAVDALERAYVAAALERSRGNQTVAARLLGLSRFGLQKKLRRLSAADEPADD